MQRQRHRARRLRPTVGIVAVAAACSIVLAACGSGAPPAPPASQGNVVNEATPQHVALINSEGQTVTLASFRGKDIVLAPFLSLCTDECPLVTGAFIALQHDMAAAGLSHKVVFMEVSVDWQRDTPARLSAYAKEFGASWPLLTATQANMAKFWKPFGVSYQEVPEGSPPQTDWWTGKPLTFDVNHTDGYILINAQGRERFINAAPPNLKGQLNPKLSSLLGDGGKQNFVFTVRSQLDTASRTQFDQLVGGPNYSFSRHHMRVPNMKKIMMLLVGLVCVGLGAASCGKGPVSTLSGTPVTNSSLTLSTESSPAGPILTDGQGHTLYDFVPDTSTESHCVSTTCVFLWPPLVVNHPITVGKDLSQSLVGKIQRPDGSTQVTYGGHPLYTYNSDVKPGMVLGQAISQAGGLWYVISPTGQQITTGFSVAS